MSSVEPWDTSRQTVSPSHVPTSARRGVFAPLETRGRVDAVEHRLLDAIQLGLFADGEQLPSEAELAARLGVATVTLREALVGLRRRGVVQTRRGRGGGSFVRAPRGGARAVLLERLSERTIDELRDFGDLHGAVAGAASALAAERASAPDLDRLRAHVDALADARSDAERRRADSRFHVELAAAARSRRLTAAEMEAQTESGALVWLVLGEDGAQRALAEHEAILDAVERRDAEAARRLAAEHVAHQTRRLIARRLALGTRGDAPTPRGDGAVAARGRAQAVLDEVNAAVDQVHAGVAEIRAAVAALQTRARAGGRLLRRSDLGTLRELLHATLEHRDQAIVGTGMVFAPGVLDDVPRWLEWWCATPDGPPAFLNASLEPEDPDFYDYEAAEWFATPRATGERWIAGPFVDYSGTDQHIFTLTLPVIEDGAFLGVAGADISVGRIEDIAGGPLAAVGQDALLVNHRGRVIASSTPRQLVGTLWAPTDDDESPVPATPGWTTRPDGACVLRDDRLPWAVVTLPSTGAASS